MESISNVWNIFRKEFAGYFNSPVAYVFIVLFLLSSSAYLLAYKDFFELNRADLRPLFEGLPWAFLVLVPAISMRIWSEEKKLKTFQLLMTLPMRPMEIILGKFFAAWAVLGLALVLTVPVALTVEIMPGVDLEWGPVGGGYLGAFVVVGAYLAIGLFVSGLTDNQLIAFVVTVVLLVFLVGISLPEIILGVQSRFPGLAGVLSGVGILSRFGSIARGVIDSKDLVYFFTLILFFLGLNRYTIESHRFG